MLPHDSRKAWWTFVSGAGTRVRLVFEFFVAKLLAGPGILLPGVGVFLTFPVADYSFFEQLGEEARVMGT